MLQILKKPLFRVAVQGAGHFIQQQDRASGEDRAGDGKALHLPLGEAVAPFAQAGVQALFQAAHKVGAGDVQRGPDRLVIGGPGGVGKAHHLADGAAHEEVPLRDVGKEPLPLRREGNLRPRAVPKQALAAVGGVEAHQDLQDRRLAAAAGSREGHGLALMNREGKIPQDDGLALLAQFLQLFHRGVIGKAHVAQLHRGEIPFVVILGLREAPDLRPLVAGIGLDLHQALGAGQHGVEAGQEAREAGKGRLDLADELGNGREGAEAHRPPENAVAAPEEAQQIHAAHGAAEAGVEDVGIAVAEHAGGLVLGHLPVRAGLGLLFGGKGAQDGHGREALLQKDAQGAVLLLHLLVQPLHEASEEPGQEDHQEAGGHQDHHEAPVQNHQHHQGRGKLDQEADETRHEGDHAVGHQDGVIRHAVEPLGRVHRAHRPVVAVEQLAHEAVLEAVLHIRAGQGVEMPQQRTQVPAGRPPSGGSARDSGRRTRAARTGPRRPRPASAAHRARRCRRSRPAGASGRGRGASRAPRPRAASGQPSYSLFETVCACRAPESE